LSPSETDIKGIESLNLHSLRNSDKKSHVSHNLIEART
jgi:hypothetical protein